MPRISMNKEQKSVSSNNHFNIIDILLVDHSYLKECIEDLTDEGLDKKLKFKRSLCFLDALKKHSAGEKKAVYAPLEEYEDLRQIVLESEVEHRIFDSKVKELSSKISNVKSLDEKMEAELRVLAEYVLTHINKEEKELFPELKRNIEKKMLNQMGYQFMVVRQFTGKDLTNYPSLKEEMPLVKKCIVPARNFSVTAHEYFGSMGAR